MNNETLTRELRVGVQRLGLATVLEMLQEECYDRWLNPVAVEATRDVWYDMAGEVGKVRDMAQEKKV